jgi:hypothetical protein
MLYPTSRGWRKGLRVLGIYSEPVDNAVGKLLAIIISKQQNAEPAVQDNVLLVVLSRTLLLRVCRMIAAMSKVVIAGVADVSVCTAV